MRHGIPSRAPPPPGTAIITGAVDAMVVDVQCEHGIPGQRGQMLPHQDDHHRRPGQEDRQTMHIPFDDHHALDVARQVIRDAIDNFPTASPR